MNVHTIAIYTPEYFPTAETMGALSLADVVVLADTFRYAKQTRQNRASIRNPNGWQWLSVPIARRPAGTSICDSKINASEPWMKKHWKAMQFNYRSSPYFEYYEDQLIDLYQSAPENLADLTCASVIRTSKLFGFEQTFVRASALGGMPKTEKDCLALCPEHNQVAIQNDNGTVRCTVKPFRQNFVGFVPGLSAIDLLFNMGPRSSTYLEFEEASIG